MGIFPGEWRPNPGGDEQCVRRHYYWPRRLTNSFVQCARLIFHSNLASGLCWFQVGYELFSSNKNNVTPSVNRGKTEGVLCNVMPAQLV